MSQEQAPYTTKIIPVEFGTNLRKRARTSRKLKLENLLDLRTFIEENADYIHKAGWMQFYAEAGDWTDVSAASVRDDLGIIRSYPESDLRYWVNNGFSFQHIDTANWLQNVKESKYTEAAALLNDAIMYGNGTGKRMTVEEMITFALGEAEPRSNTFSIVKTLTGWIEKLPQRLKWNDEKKTRFESAVRVLINDFFEE